jgi:hypothetical protein
MANQSSASTRSSRQQYYTLRMTFSYEGTHVQLIAQQRIEMLPPLAEPDPIQPGQSGFWYELRDASERVLFQRRAHNPIEFEMTIYSNDPGIPMQKVDIPDPKGVFELLAPDIEGATAIVLFSSPIDPEFAAGPATELARFAIGH